MIDPAQINEGDIRKHAAWLEHEINICLEFDLPTMHLEDELVELNDIIRLRHPDSVLC